MPIFYLKSKPFSRKSGRSIVKHVVSLFGEKLYDVATQRYFNARKNDAICVLSSRLHLPKKVFLEKYLLNKKCLPSDFLDRQTLWNLAEFSETRRNSRTAREIIVNMPGELSVPLQIHLMNLFAQYLSDKYQVAVDAVLRSPPVQKQLDNNDEQQESAVTNESDNSENDAVDSNAEGEVNNDKNDENDEIIEQKDKPCFRAHFLLSTRIIELNEQNDIVFGRKSILEWSNSQLKNADLPSCQNELKSIREAWAAFTNRVLETAGIQEKIDARSYAEQGVKISPTLPLGPIEFALEKKKIATKRGDYNRQIVASNAKIIENERLYERKADEAIADTDTFIETFSTTTEAAYRAFIRREKFTARSNQTDKFLEKYHHKTAETDRRIDTFNGTKP